MERENRNERSDKRVTANPVFTKSSYHFSCSTVGIYIGETPGSTAGSVGLDNPKSSEPSRQPSRHFKDLEGFSRSVLLLCDRLGIRTKTVEDEKMLVKSS